MEIKCPLCFSTTYKSEIIGSTEVFQCLNCKLIFLHDQNNTRSYFTNYYQRYRNDSNSVVSILRQKQYQIDARHFNRILCSGNVLDVGCSSGGFIFQLDKIGKYDFTGIDVDGSAIDLASSVASNKPNMNFICDDLLSCNFNKKFNAIIFRGSFQYLGEKLFESINFIKQSLLDGGKIIIYSLPNSKSLLYFLLKDNWNMFHPIEHKLIFNDDVLMFLAKQFNFIVKELSYPYLETPYANIDRDYKAVIDIIRNGSTISTPFWGNIIQCVLEKRKN